MTKTLLLALACGIAVGLVGCKGSDDTTAAGTTSGTTGPQVEPTAGGTGEPKANGPKAGAPAAAGQAPGFKLNTNADPNKYAPGTK